MDNLIIEIYKSSNDDGYYYNIYDQNCYELDVDKSMDGGFCTTNIINALEMAVEQVKKLI